MLVRHAGQPGWGHGKVVERVGDEVRIYFAGDGTMDADAQIRRFPMGTTAIVVLADQSDPHLDDIPPVKDGRFVRMPTSSTLDDARRRFLQWLPRGFSDPKYYAEERDYKWAAHERYRSILKPRLAQTPQQHTPDVGEAVSAVYWPTNGETPLNLLSPRFEFPQLRDALRSSAHALEYAQAAEEFSASEDPSNDQFQRYAGAVTGLPSRTDGISLSKWTILTWLPFIANPAHHVYLKPQMTQEFASRMPFELQYKPELNHTTYARLQQMARRLRQRVSDMELNPEQRDLDMIDVHAFMWVVTEWGQ